MNMKSDWNERARQNAFHYVSTFKEKWTERDFFCWGSEQTRFVVFNFLDSLGKEPADMTMVEIGCGVGRMTRHLSTRFKYVYAYDVSEEMIDEARSLNSCLSNVSFLANDGRSFPEVEDGSVDYVFSGWTFQHMPSKRVVEDNVREIARILFPSGMYQVQVGLWEGYVRLGRVPIPREALRFVPDRCLNVYSSLTNKDSLKVSDTFRGVKFTVKEFLKLLNRSGLKGETKRIRHYNSFTGREEAFLWFIGRACQSVGKTLPG